jgi:DNA-binding SARP family transcriptional activator
MKSRTASGLVLGLWTATLALEVVAEVLDNVGQTGGRAGAPQPAYVHLLFLEMLAFSTAGALIARRRPSLPAGWLLMAVGLGWTAVGALDGYVQRMLAAGRAAAPVTTFAAWLVNWVWLVAFGAVGLFFVLFPDGRLPGRSWRVVVWAGAAGGALVLASRALAPGPLAEVPAVVNPFGVPGAGSILRGAEALGNPMFAVSEIAAVASLVARYRHAGEVQRRQLLCMALAACVFAAVMLGGNVASLIGVPGIDPGDVYVASFASVPIAAVIAILRYRLYDIDLVIGKAIVLGGLLGFITIVYLGVVVGIGAVVGQGTGSNALLAVVATALAAVGAQPLRVRLQRLARQVVFPAASDAERSADVAIRTLGAFRVLRGGQPVPLASWQSKKARTLVKMLVSRRGRATTRDQLMDALWPDEPPAAVTRRLSVALATARAVLDPEHRYPADYFLVAEKDAVRLDLANVQVDVDCFLRQAAFGLDLHRAGRLAEARDALGEAEAAYGGDFLEEDRYEDWAAPMREEARAAYHTVTMTLAEIAICAGDHAAAVRHYLRVLESDEHNEPAHLGLVAALDQDGRHGEARRAYRVYTERMAQIEVPVAPFPSSGRVTPAASIGLAPERAEP